MVVTVELNVTATVEVPGSPPPEPVQDDAVHCAPVWIAIADLALMVAVKLPEDPTVNLDDIVSAKLLWMQSGPQRTRCLHTKLHW